MLNKKVRLFFVVVVIASVMALSLAKAMQKKASGEVIKEIKPVMGSIKTFISCTGTVLPKNRLEIKPPVNGRIERILVKEGEKVKIGQALVIMSSTDRAALLDAARGKSEDEVKYWQETYNPISLPAPIEGEVIVATTQPGQTVTTSDAVVVLSDHLIARAQVDETDIGKIALGMKAVITLDAYPEIRIKASVEHMYYESKTVNNVTIYEVDLVPENVPQFFRSGMNASIDFMQYDKQNILVIPVEAAYQNNGQAYVLLKQNNNGEPLQAPVTLGVSDDKNVEVLSGITTDSRIMVKSKKYALPKNAAGKNPFMPGRSR